MSFDEYGLSPELMKGLADVSIENPTPLQKLVVPAALQGKSMLVKVETADDGAVVIPVLQRIVSNGEVSGTRILILTPSAARAKQLDQFIWAMGYHAGISSAAVSLKGDKKEQETAVTDGAPVIVANPGQLSDILRKTGTRFSNLAAVVIDCADEMDKHNLVARVESVFGQIDGKPQLLIFAGSVNQAVSQLHAIFDGTPEYIGIESREFAQQMKDAAPASSEKKKAPAGKKNTQEKTGETPSPEEKLKEAGVKVVLKKDLESSNPEPEAIDRDLTQGYINVPPRMKISTLMAHLEKSPGNNAVVFTASKRTSDRLFRIILKKNWGVVSVHEGIDEATFKERFDRFKSGEMKVLVAGGMSAESLDLDNVQQVINYDVPETVDEYRYRAELVGNGKAARVISLVSGMDREDINRIVEEAGYPPVELDLPKSVQEKKKKKKPPAEKQQGKKGRHREAGKGRKHKHRRTGGKPGKPPQKRSLKRSARELPRPSYDGLSGGRDGHKKGGVIGWIKKLFS